MACHAGGGAGFCWAARGGACCGAGCRGTAPLMICTREARGNGGGMISYADFEKVDIRVGRIVRAEPFPEARKPAIKLQIDFGPELGVRKSSAQLTRHYRTDELEGRLVLAVVNFPPRQIGPMMSEVLTLGVPDADGAVILVVPDKDAPLGGRLF